MRKENELAAIFLSESGTDPIIVPVGALSALEQALAQAWDQGRQTWPDVILEASLFTARLAHVLQAPWAADQGMIERISRLPAADLYLAYACEQGLPAALVALETHYLCELLQRQQRHGYSTSDIDEIHQITRTQLLVRSPDEPPEIAKYTGKGALKNWLHVVVTRIGLILRRLRDNNTKLWVDIDDSPSWLPAPDDDPELRLIKQQFRAAFQPAVREAFAHLAAEERRLLWLHFGERLSTPALATLLHVNQSTIWRRIQHAEQRLYLDVKQKIQQHLGLSSDEFTSHLRVVGTWSDESLRSLLVVRSLSHDEAA